MAALLNTSSKLQCPHGGQVQITSSNTKTKGGGDALVRSTDTFTISGCPFSTSVGPHPCVTVQWLTTANKVKADSGQTLTKDSSGLCKAGDQVPQGSVTIVSTQTKVSGM
jgi:hypothetical protein